MITTNHSTTCRRRFNGGPGSFLPVFSGRGRKSGQAWAGSGGLVDRLGPTRRSTRDSTIARSDGPILQSPLDRPDATDLFMAMLEYCERAGLSPYAEQERAFEALAEDQHVVLATPTGSGEVTRRPRRSLRGVLARIQSAGGGDRRSPPAFRLYRSDQGPRQREVLQPL